MPAARRVALWFLGALALAIPAALLLGAYLRILIALWAAFAWVRWKLNASGARMSEEDRNHL